MPSDLEAATGAAGSIAWIPSVRQDPAGPVSEPFVTDQICVREMVVIQPESRQVLFERFGYSNPTYGAVVEAPFPTSQVTHSGLVTTGDPDVFLGFYESLGMLRTRDGSVSKADDIASQRIFDLGPEESYLCWDFDDPRSSPVPSKWLSGRLKFIHFPTGTPLEDARAKAQLGGLGHTAYTWRVRDLDAVCALNDAIVVAEPGADEFGARTARVIAPDGYDWLFIETPSTAAPADSAG